MLKPKHYISLLLLIFLYFTGCKVPAATTFTENRSVPSSYSNGGGDTTNISSVRWRTFFNDKNLVNLIDTALKNNQELNITLQEIQIAGNEIRLRQAPFLPVLV